MSGRLTLGRWLTDRARTTPDRIAIDYHDRELDYRELGDAAIREGAHAGIFAVASRRKIAVSRRAISGSG